MSNQFKIKNIITVIFILFTIIKTSHALENKILFKINNEIITTIDILNESNYLKLLNPKINTLDNEKLIQISKNSLIKEKIRKIAILRVVEKINLSDEYLAKVITSLHTRKGFKSLEEFKNNIKKNNLKIEYIENKISIDSLWNEIIYKKFGSKVVIDKIKITNEVVNSPDKKLLLSEILFAINKDEINKKFQEIKDDIEKEGFKNAALIHSVSNSATSGGDIGWIDENSLNKNIINEIKKLKIGQHTKPILTASGFLILKVEDIKNNDAKIESINEKINTLVRIKTNQQLNQFSNIYYNKIKKDLVINEL